MEKMAYLFSFKTSKIGRIMRNFQFRFSHLLILIILFLASFLRLYRIDEYMTFLGDEGRDVLVVREIILGIGDLINGDFAGAREKLTLLGPTASVGGFFLGPIYYYFMAPFLWIFNFNPVGPAVMVALFGVATVWLVYKVGSDFFNPFTGLVAAFLYAISPIVIAYSRSSWNPNIMPFFSLIALYTVYWAVKKRSFFLFFVCGVILGIAIQLHYLTLFLGVVIALYIILEQILWKGTFLGSLARLTFVLGGFLIGLAPFFGFEVRHGFPNTQSIFRFVILSGDTGSNEKFMDVIHNVFFRLFGRLTAAFPPPEQVSLQESFLTLDLFLGKVTISAGIWYSCIALFAYFATGLLFYQCYIKLRRKDKDFNKLLLFFLWLVVGIGLFGFYKKSIYDYYLGFLFPLPFLLVGNALHFLWEKRHMYRVLAIGIFTILFLLNLQGIPFRYPPNRQLAQVEQIAGFVLDKTDGKPFNFALITGGNSDHGYRYFFALAGKDPKKIENSQIDSKRTTVTDQLLVVCEKLPCYPLGDPLWEVAGFGRAEIIGEWDVSVVKVYKLVHYKP